MSTDPWGTSLVACGCAMSAVVGDAAAYVHVHVTCACACACSCCACAWGAVALGAAPAQHLACAVAMTPGTSELDVLKMSTE